VKATLDKKRMVITLPLFIKPRRSKSGKSMLVASSHGPRKASFSIDGHPLYVVANAYIKNLNTKSTTKGRKAGAEPRSPNEDGEA